MAVFRRRPMKQMSKSGRRSLVVVGAVFTAFGVLALGGFAWSLLTRYAFFVPSRQKAQCLRNVEVIAAAKAAYAREGGLTNGAPVARDQLVDLIEGGWQDVRCPKGGAYDIGAVGDPVECSIPAHRPD
jgi:hypothetical protein